MVKRCKVGQVGGVGAPIGGSDRMQKAGNLEGWAVASPGMA